MVLRSRPIFPGQHLLYPVGQHIFAFVRLHFDTELINLLGKEKGSLKLEAVNRHAAAVGMRNNAC